MNFSMTGQEKCDLLKACDSLIEVAAWAGLRVRVMMFSATFNNSLNTITLNLKPSLTVQLYHINFCKRHVPFIVGTANANVPVEKIAIDMVGVIYNYKPRHIQEVHVVIWQSSTLRSFIDATQKYMDKIKQETAGMMEKIVETVGIGKIVYHFKHCVYY